MCTRKKPLAYCLLAIASLLPMALFSQTSPISFTAVPFSNIDFFYTPGRGAEQWHYGNDVNVPDENTSSPRTDYYRRFQWSQFENATQDAYNWKDFDTAMHEAIRARQKFSFGIMTAFEGVFPEGDGYLEFDNGYASYPGYLHTLMQSETNKDWRAGHNGAGADPTCTDCMWVPNWNSDYYLNRWGALNRALAQHIATTSYLGVPYANVIQYVDIRGYGNYGEWHTIGYLDNVDNSPAGTRIAVASQKRIIDSVVAAFPNYPLVVMIAAFESYKSFFVGIKNDSAIAHYVLTQSNNWGKFGWRKDSYGSEEAYLSSIMENNDGHYQGVRFDTAIMNRYKYSPIVGEPNGGTRMTVLPYQVRLYHTNSFGNGNYLADLTNGTDASDDSVRLASKLAGYRVLLDSGRITTTIIPGTSFQLKLYWKNVGLNPPYENWSAGFQLKNAGGTVVWTASSSMVVKGFQPNSTASITDNLTLPGNLTAGAYTLSLIIKDPNGYRDPLPLAISGRNNDGSYDLKTITVSSCTTPTATIVASSTCNGSGFNLTLSAATGSSPYDLVINGVTYNDKTVGNTITGFTPPTQKIWPDPVTVTSAEDIPVELGLQFRSSVPGYIKGVRFYSPNDPDGTYTGRLYTSGGTLLASATFSSVTANGWQEVSFSTPVAIAANTTYVASYFTAGGRYSSTLHGLTSAVSNSPLTALAGGGVYYYGSSPGFPTSTFNNSNYWVDVLFVADAYTFNLTSITDNNGCIATGSLQTLNVSSEVCAGMSIASPDMVGSTTAESAWTYSLLQSYPNPAHGQARIAYTLAENTNVSLQLFDTHGKLVRVLASGEKAMGPHSVNVNTASLSKGIYYYTIRTKHFTATKKMVVQ
jgi:hypothetical protein